MTERRRFLRHIGRCRKWNGLWKITNWRIIIDFKDSPRVLLKSEPKYGARIRLVVERSSHVTFSFITLDYRLHGGRISWVILWIINLKLRDSARRNFFDWLALCENERKKTPAMLMRKHDARARLPYNSNLGWSCGRWIINYALKRIACAGRKELIIHFRTEHIWPNEHAVGESIS